MIKSIRRIMVNRTDVKSSRGYWDPFNYRSVAKDHGYIPDPNFYKALGVFCVACVWRAKIGDFWSCLGVNFFVNWKPPLLRATNGSKGK